MAINNGVFHATSTGKVRLNNPPLPGVVVVQLTIRDGAPYIIFGRVTIENHDTNPRNASALLTTLRGATILDRVDIHVDNINNGFIQSISLQGLVELPNPKADEFIELRASTFHGFATQASLFAMLIDGISPPVI